MNVTWLWKTVTLKKNRYLQLVHTFYHPFAQLCFSKFYQQRKIAHPSKLHTTVHISLRNVFSYTPTKAWVYLERHHWECARCCCVSCSAREPAEALRRHERIRCVCYCKPGSARRWRVVFRKPRDPVESGCFPGIITETSGNWILGPW